MRTLRSIVIGIDFSDSSRVALEHAVRIAGWSGAALHAVHIVDTGDCPSPAAHLTALQRGIRAARRDEMQHRWSSFARDVRLGSTVEKVLRDSLIAVWACKPAEVASGQA